MSRALLVIDVQNDVVNSTFNRDDVVATIADLVGEARANGTPVVWVQHNDPWLTVGSQDWQIVEELTPVEGEARIDKQYRSSFEDTELAEVVAGVDELIVCGAETNYCIRHTIHAALERGFSVTLVSDAHTCTADNAEQVIAEQNANVAHYELPGRACVVRPAADVFALTTRPSGPPPS
jgi:nicotinamidase-related amidase